MSPETIKTGLERYSSPSLDPAQLFTTLRNPITGRAVPLFWHEVATNALDYIEQMELALAAVHNNENLRIFKGMSQQLGSAALEVRRLEKKLAASEMKVAGLIAERAHTEQAVARAADALKAVTPTK